MYRRGLKFFLIRPVVNVETLFNRSVSVVTLIQPEQQKQKDYMNRIFHLNHQKKAKFMNKSIPNILTSQALNNDIILDYIGFLRDRLYVSDQLILKLIVTNLKNHNIFDYSHALIAKITGLSIRTVQRSIIRLVKHGILKSIWRPYNTCIYFLHDLFNNPSIIKKLKWLFIGIFSLGLLAPKEGVRLLILKDVIYKRTCTNIVMSTNIAAQDLYLSAAVPWLYGTEKGEPNKKVTFEQFEAQFFKEEQYMNNFTEEQLLQLAQYPKETLSYATKMLTKDMSDGKAITNQFAYFKSICERLKNKTPQRDVQQPFSRPKVGPQSVWKKEERVLETDFEWCSNVEPKLHEFVLADHPGLRITRSLADARFNRLTKEQQHYLINTVHIDCNCRQPIDTLSIPEPVTKVHYTNWNDMILPVRDENSQTDISHEYNEYEEILD